MTADIEKLKALAPCPFCGSHAQTDFIEGESYIIECYACEARTGCKDSAEAAIEAWNRRAEKEAPDLHVIPPPRGTGSQQEADPHDVIEFALGLAEKDGAQAAVNFLMAWNWESDAFLRVHWPEFAECEAATRCRAEGGGTSENMVVEKAAKNDAKPAETRMDSGFDGAGKISAPAAGTDRDAERYRLMSAQLSSGDLDYYRLEGEPQAFIDEYCDAEIEAHTKAGKPT